MDIKKLRQKILDLAISGKLVPQDPNDEPASVLLERIRAEKERLIAEGKIKRPKKSKASSAESHYQKFEIPSSWKWSTLEELIILISGQDFPQDKYNSTLNGVPYIIGASNIQNGKVVVTRWTESPTVLSEKNDLLIVCKGAGVGKMGINQIGTAHIARQIQALRPFSNYVNLEYIRVVLMKGIEIICSQANGLIPGLPRDLLLKFPIPLPPLTEQIRIVNSVAIAMNIIDRMGLEANTVQNHISLVKSKILDLAMQGKLVPQDPADEPAADMLLRINPKAKIITDNPHYPQLPDNWVLTNLESVCNYGHCDSVNVEDISSDDWILELEDIEKDSGRILSRQTKQYRSVSGIRHRFSKSDVLYSKLRTYLNKVLLAPEDGYCTAEIIPITAYDCILPEYLCSWLRSPHFMAYTLQCGYGVKMPRLSTSDARNGIVPLPPLNEQTRIIEKVRNIFSTLSDMEFFI